MACHFDEHVEEGGVHLAVAQSDEQGGEVKAPCRGDTCEESVAKHGEGDADSGVARHAAGPQALGAEEARHEQAAGKYGEEYAGAVGDPHLLLAVDGHIVAHHTPAEAEEADIDSQQPPPREEEMVETELRFAGYGFALRQPHAGAAQKPETGQCQRQPEEEGEIACGMVDVDSGTGGDSHGEIIAQAVVAESLAAAR